MEMWTLTPARSRHLQLVRHRRIRPANHPRPMARLGRQGSGLNVFVMAMPRYGLVSLRRGSRMVIVLERPADDIDRGRAKQELGDVFF